MRVSGLLMAVQACRHPAAAAGCRCAQDRNVERTPIPASSLIFCRPPLHMSLLSHGEPRAVRISRGMRHGVQHFAMKAPVLKEKVSSKRLVF